ncbi:MAG: HD domain-containing protein [Alphaproteobacteria bacterium]|nr:HD domain-containing protein [Alphaproteobacteria bacterium]
MKEARRILAKVYANRISFTKKLSQLPDLAPERKKSIAFSLKYLKRKRAHSGKVYKQACAILKQEPELKKLPWETKTAIKCAALLHDIGRSLNIGPNGEYDHSIRHGKQGAQLLLTGFGIADPVILLAVSYHDSKDMSDMYADRAWQNLPRQDRLDAAVATKITRDADKLANLLDIKSQKHFSKYFNRKSYEISPRIAESFAKRRTADWRDEKTLADRTFILLAWCFDLNYGTTRKIIKDKRIVAKLVKSFLPRAGLSDSTKETKALALSVLKKEGCA